jgi:hypothetical protein
MLHQKQSLARKQKQKRKQKIPFQAFAVKELKTNLATMLDANRKKVSSIEMKTGIMDVAEGLRFLHQDAKTAHLG